MSNTSRAREGVATPTAAASTTPAATVDRHLRLVVIVVSCSMLSGMDHSCHRLVVDPAAVGCDRHHDRVLQHVAKRVGSLLARSPMRWAQFPQILGED